IRALQRAGFRPRRGIELLIFASEEPTRFGIGCLGSRLLAGTLDLSVGDSFRDRDGVSLNEARAAAGFTGSLARFGWRQDITPLSSSFTSSRGPCSSSAAFHWAWSRRSPLPPALRFGSKARAAMPAPSSWRFARMLFSRLPRSLWPWKRLR